MDDLSQKHPVPTIYLDAGNSLFKKSNKVSENTKTNASEILSALEAMKLNAMAVGPKDLSAGSAFLLNSFSSTQPLSANLLNKQTGVPVFKRYILLDVGNLKVGVIGLTESHRDLLENYIFLNTQTSLRDVLEIIQPEADFVVLLSNLPTPQNEEIAKEFHDIQLIISSDNSKGMIKSRSVNNSLIVQTINRGKQLGLLQLEVGTDKRWSPDFKSLIKSTSDQLAGVDWQIKRANSLNTKNPAEKQIPTEKLLSRQIELNKKIDQLGKDQSLSREEGLDSTFNCTFYKLHKDIKEKDSINQLFKTR